MSDLYVYSMRSRNKDNKNIPNFKERTKTMLEYRSNEDRIVAEFRDFANKGVHGEQTRLYRSVNSRNEDKIREELIIRLLRDKSSVTKLNQTLVSVAQHAENRDESKWLFDFDEKDEQLLNEFVQDIPVCTQLYETPNGYAVICEHGFDVRELLNRWEDHKITLHRDRLLFLDIITKTE